ncbi:RNA pol II accessory factor, Cdc73 family-domain-containing protein [Melampsora americana]|nr:RNA pol II accessory factor, Cdc73 family-domain-containing protein [Melampsora americana]
MTSLLSSSSSSSNKLDPLILLRRAITNRNDIHLLSHQNQKVFNLSECDNLSLPTSNGNRILIPKKILTRYKKPDTPAHSTPIESPHDFFDLQSILLCYLNREKGFGSYIQEANLQKCEFVTATERKLLNDYLESKNSMEPLNIINLDLTQSIYKDLNQDSIQPLNPSHSTDHELTSNQTQLNPSRLQEGSSNPTINPEKDFIHDSQNQRISPMKRSRYLVDRTDQELVKRIMQLHEVRQVSDRKSVLRGNHQKIINFENARSLVLDRIKSSKEDLKIRQSGTHSNGISKSIGTSIGNGINSAKRRPMNPIIIISPSSSALITMQNVKRFLEDAVFEPPNVSKASGHQSIASEDVVEVRHRRGYTSSSQTLLTSHSSLGTSKSNPSTDRAVRYFVVDGVDALSKFGEDAWDRVVCVMTTGQEWQFRPYRWSDPKELFHHGLVVHGFMFFLLLLVKGFFMQWTHDPPNPKVRAWNVTELRIDQSKRHIDKSAAADFWRSLEAWIALHKPFVAY